MEAPQHPALADLEAQYNRLVDQCSRGELSVAQAKDALSHLVAIDGQSAEWSINDQGEFCRALPGQAPEPTDTIKFAYPKVPADRGAPWASVTPPQPEQHSAFAAPTQWSPTGTIPSAETAAPTSYEEFLQQQQGAAAQNHEGFASPPPPFGAPAFSSAPFAQPPQAEAFPAPHTGTGKTRRRGPQLPTAGLSGVSSSVVTALKKRKALALTVGVAAGVLLVAAAATQHSAPPASAGLPVTPSSIPATAATTPVPNVNQVAIIITDITSGNPGLATSQIQATSSPTQTALETAALAGDARTGLQISPGPIAQAGTGAVQQWQLVGPTAHQVDATATVNFVLVSGVWKLTAWPVFH